MAFTVGGSRIYYRNPATDELTVYDRQPTSRDEQFPSLKDICVKCLTLTDLEASPKHALGMVDRHVKLEKIARVVEKARTHSDLSERHRALLKKTLYEVAAGFDHKKFCDFVPIIYTLNLIIDFLSDDVLLDENLNAVAILEELIYKVKKFGVEPHALTSVDDADLLMALYEVGERIPDHIKSFDHLAKHPMNVMKYLDVRIARTIGRLIYLVNSFGRNTEIFIGSKSHLMQYYKWSGYSSIVEIGTNNSNKYYLVQHHDPRLNKVVISGIGSSSRLHNVLLQLKFCDVDLDKSVVVRGKFSDALQAMNTELSVALKSFDKPPRMAFVGNRTQIVIELAKYLYPSEMANVPKNQQETKAEELLTNRNGLETKDVGGVYKFSYIKVKIQGQECGIIGFRMPNGSLAFEATQLLLDAGVKDLILVGAGGSLKTEMGVGSYQVVVSSQYQDKTIAIPRGQIMDLQLSGMPLASNCTNVTVDSPLEENDLWLEGVQKKGTTSVDVETYHIFRAIQETNEQDVHVFPGLFISDVVGAHPLEEKISLENAYPHLPQLIQASFNYAKVENLK